MSDIEVGEYIRTKKGIIRKVKYVHVNYISAEKPYKIKNVITNRVWNEDIVKHSKNIIKLIEVNDYVNNEIVIDIGDRVIYIGYSGGEEYSRIVIDESEIKSIVTKEQFEQNSYKIGE